MVRLTSCVCTILQTGWRFDVGSRCWPRPSSTKGNRRRRSTIARRCCASPIARPCARTMRVGRARWHCQSRCRLRTFGNTSIPTLRLAPSCSVCATAALRSRMCATELLHSSQMLWRHNTFLIGRDVARARPGDLLFFRQDTAERMPFHAMIYLGNSQIDPGSEKFVVYHTGPNGKSPGQMKRLSITELLNYPDARWQPVPSNPVFLGVYRWNILRGGE